MRKKFILLLAFVFLFIILLTGKNFILADVDKDNKNFVVGFDAEFPPYGYKNQDGEYVGFDLDLAQKVCEIRGWNLVKQPIEWSAKDMELKNGSIDCIWNGFSVNGRENDYTWTIPYINNSQVVVTKSNLGIKNLNDLAGKVVGVQTGSSALAALTGDDATDENKKLAKSFANLLLVNDYNTGFLNLESGVVDAICMDIGVAAYEIKSRANANFIILPEYISEEKYAIGFLKGNIELRNKVQETLLDMQKNGVLNQIAEKYSLETSLCLDAKDIELINKLDNNIYKKNLLGELIDISRELLNGLAASSKIFLLTLIFSLPLGLLVAFARMSKIKIISLATKFYISIVRGTPLILQLLVVFFGPYFIFGLKTKSEYRFYAVIIGFVINYAAYFAEIYRSGIKAIPKGQYQAAEILGYNKYQCFYKIIFLQMIKNVLPAITNEVITLIKDTSLAFAISYAEMFTIARQISAARTSILPLFIAGLFYYVFNLVTAFLMESIEKKLNYFA